MNLWGAGQSSLVGRAVGSFNRAIRPAYNDRGNTALHFGYCKTERRDIGNHGINNVKHKVFLKNMFATD